jgi:hypothetical protein
MPFKNIATLATFSVSCALVVVLATSLMAEVPSIPKDALHRAATHIVTGDVVRIYDRSYAHGAGATIRYISEVRVKAVEKGEGMVPESLIYVSYFTLDNPPHTTGTSGHRGLPKDGDRIRFYLVRNADDGYGAENNDGGLNVLFPNGFEQLPIDGSKKEH